MARVVRRRWSSVAATGIAVVIIALCPLPTEGHSGLVGIGGGGLEGEMLEQLVRLTLWISYRGIVRLGQAAAYLLPHR